MKTFPMFLKMANRRVVIVGGGEQATQKCRLMLKTEAQVTILRGPITVGHFEDTALAFIATGCPGMDTALHALAKAAKTVVNVVDQPDLCDAITPSIVDRDPVVVAIGTEGTAPVLARQIKTRMEEVLEPRLGDTTPQAP